MYDVFIDKVKDLGVIKGIRFWSVRCNVCSKVYKARASNVKFRNRTVCTYCAPKVRHGESHGSREHPLYDTWSLMLRRVDNTENKKFGNDSSYNGIKVCEDWKAFNVFKLWAESNGYSESLTLDRIHSEGNYEPTNCRWADLSTQNANRGVCKRSTTGYTGVTESGRPDTPYTARVTWKGKTLLQKRFKSLQEAIEARNKIIADNNLPHPIQQFKGN